MTAKCAAQWT